MNSTASDGWTPGSDKKEMRARTQGRVAAATRPSHAGTSDVAAAEHFGEGRDAVNEDEPSRRFEDRENTADKRHKITDENDRNHDVGLYEQSMDDMVSHNGAVYAQRRLIPAEKKAISCADRGVPVDWSRCE